jgi:uncharacterized protein YjbI with pentapeptide repeats
MAQTFYILNPTVRQTSCRYTDKKALSLMGHGSDLPQIYNRSQRRPGGAGTRQDFSYKDLRGHTFEQAQLQFANFHGANLQGANLRAADARGAIFAVADLTRADCTGALLQGAHLQRARLAYTVFRQAFLLSAHLEFAFVEGADFSAANLEWAWVEGVHFQHATVVHGLFLNVRGLASEERFWIEAQGGFTGRRPMMLGRELYEEA